MANTDIDKNIGASRGQRIKAIPARARSFINENLPTLAANAGLSAHPDAHQGAQPSPTVAAASLSGSKRKVTLTKKGAEDAESRAALREQHEYHQQRLKRKAEAEARGNASQPGPLPTPKRHKVVSVPLAKPEDLLDLPYKKLVKESDQIKWLRMALIRRDGKDSFEPGMGREELEEIFDEAPTALEVDGNVPTGVSTGKTVVMQHGKSAAKLRGTDHTTIGLGGAPNYPELPRGPTGKPIGPIALEEEFPEPDKQFSPPAAGNTGSNVSGSSTIATRLPGAHKSVTKPEAARSAHKTVAKSGAVVITHARSAKPITKNTPRQAAQLLTPKSQPRRQAPLPQAPSPPAHDLPLDEGDAQPADEDEEVVAVEEESLQKLTKRQQAQLCRFGDAIPVVTVLCERIKVRFATQCPFAESIGSSEMDEDGEDDEDDDSIDPSRTLLDDWLEVEWPRANRTGRPGQAPLPMKDKYRRYLRSQFSRWRCEIKIVMAAKIPYVYPLLRNIKCQQNIDEVKKLEPDRFHSPNLARDKHRFQHDSIGDGIKDVYYTSKHSIGFKYVKPFKAMPATLIAFFCCVTRHCIREYATGVRVSVNLNSQDLLEYWRMYKKVLDDMAEPGHEPNRLRRYQKRLFIKCHGPEIKQKPVVVIPTPIQWETDSESEEDDDDDDDALLVKKVPQIQVQMTRKPELKGKARHISSSPPPIRNPSPIDMDMTMRDDPGPSAHYPDSDA